MCSLILFSLYSNDLLKYKNRIIKTCFRRGFEFVKKTVILRKISFAKITGTITKVKSVTKTKKHNQSFFLTLVLALPCYCGDKRRT